MPIKNNPIENLCFSKSSTDLSVLLEFVCEYWHNIWCKFGWNEQLMWFNRYSSLNFEVQFFNWTCSYELDVYEINEICSIYGLNPPCKNCKFSDEIYHNHGDNECLLRDYFYWRTRVQIWRVGLYFKNFPRPKLGRNLGAPPEIPPLSPYYKTKGEGEQGGHAPSEVSLPQKWPQPLGWKFSDYMMVLCQKLHICTYVRQTFLDNPPYEDLCSHALPSQSGNARTAPV